MRFGGRGTLPAINDDEIIKQASKGVRAIAKAQHRSVAQVNGAIDRSAASVIESATIDAERD